MKRWILAGLALAVIVLLLWNPADPLEGLEPEGYSAFLLGGEGISYSAQTLERHGLGDLTGGSIEQQLDRAEAILSNYPVKQLYWSLDLFIEEYEPLEQDYRDYKRIGSLESYDTQHHADFAYSTGTLSKVTKALDRVKKLCAEKNVELTVLLAPVHHSRWEAADQADLRSWLEGLAQQTDYLDFSLSGLSYDDRFFYDYAHARPAAGDLVLSAFFGETAALELTDFGVPVTRETSPAHLDRLWAGDLRMDPAAYTAPMPILLYHHISDEQEPSDTCISESAFRHQMELLVEWGYTAVTIPEMIDFVYNHGALPEKAVLITFDDGYQSNFDVAYPILQELGLKGTIFTIGVSIGKSFYKDTDNPMIPHFGYDEIREMLASGVMDIQSHTYDMHQWEPFETGEVIRTSVRRLPEETEEEYAAALQADWDRYRQEMEAETGHKLIALAYPGGNYESLSEVNFHRFGVPVTLSTWTKSQNELVRGIPQSLYGMCRWNIEGDCTDEEFREILEGTFHLQDTP